MKVPETGAKRTMLDAAERLVAEKGFDSVSIRDVTGAAKANVAAVNYHFGSREGLLDLVITHILEPLCAERIARLEAAGKQVSVEEAVAAYVNALPPAAARIGMDGPLFFRLAGRIQCLPDGALAPALEDARREVTRRFLAALGKSLPETPAKDLAADWAFFEAGLAQSLVIEAEDRNIAALMARWIAFGVRGFGATAKPKNDPQGLLFEL
jgi:AcrR family transcriptional regulator